MPLHCFGYSGLALGIIWVTANLLPFLSCLVVSRLLFMSAAANLALLLLIIGEREKGEALLKINSPRSSVFIAMPVIHGK